MLRLKKSLFFILLPLCLNSQTGPGGVGNTIGTSNLKIWYNADSVLNSGTTVDTIYNLAGIPALSVGETGARRPTVVTNAVNSYDEISFNGENRLRTGLTLTAANFVNDEATSFIVCQADKTQQTACPYTTDPLASNRFTNHVPWNSTVYFDIGTCCSSIARMQVGSLVGLTSYSVWSFDAHPTTGKQLYRGGALLQDRAGSSTFSNHASYRFNVGGDIPGTDGYEGDITEIIVFNTKVNSTQRIIIENYLSAKYGLASAANDLYNEDDAANGNYDHNVAGIGRISATNLHNDSQGTGIVRILNPTNLGNNEFMIWGHDDGELQAVEIADVPAGVATRFERIWRVSERNTANTSSVNVGNVDMRWDLSGLGAITASDLRLLIDTDNDGAFSDETPISGATALGSNIYEFSAVPGGAAGLRNNRRFTLGTINQTQTPLPIELLDFSATVVDNKSVKLEWKTTSEFNNDFFMIERSYNGINWKEIQQIDGAGNSNQTLVYETHDKNPHKGLSYYRLKQVDLDGFIDDKGVKSVSVEHISLDIYPNPANVQVIIRGDSKEINHLKIYNILGQEVSQNVKLMNASDTEITIDLSGLKSGIYIIKTATEIKKLHKL